MKVLVRRIPIFSRAVSFCDDDWLPEFNCIVTPKGWLWKIGWVWLGIGRMDRIIKQALRDYLLLNGHQTIQFERLEVDGPKSRCYRIERATEQPGIINWPWLLSALISLAFVWSIML